MSKTFELPPEVKAFLDDLLVSWNGEFPKATLEFLFLITLGGVFFYLSFLILQKIILKKQIARYARNLKIINEIEDLEIPNEKKIELKNLLQKCVQVGAQIDFHTDRKRNSREVSSLVQKISEELQFDLQKKIIFVCTSMVYDVGFLEMSEELFRAEVLSSQEKSKMMRHILDTENLDFVPQEFHKFFFDAITFHHENFDGTGFPEGLVGKEIPEVARIIRAVESFVSLTSKKSYRRTLAPLVAIKELYTHRGVYDEEILLVLEKIITQKK